MVNADKLNICAFLNLLKEEKAFAVSMAEKSKEFLASGAIYHGNIPEGAKERH